jgi:hypothetical protein
MVLDVTATPPPESPRVLGRTANRILIAGLLLSLAALVLFLLRDSDWMFVALVAVAAFGLLLFALPVALFLFYSRRTPLPEVTSRMRRAIYVSAGLLLLGGALAAWGALGDRSAVGVVLGILVGAVGGTAIVRAARFAPPLEPVARLDYGRSSIIGAFFFLIVVVITPKFACGCGSKEKAYRAELKSDLRSLIPAEEVYFSDHRRYGTRPELGGGFFAATNDSIVAVPIGSQGYYATGIHAYLPGVVCGFWVGVRPSERHYDPVEGVVACWQVR